jgi:SPP1 gp7 family putative phage head morphogenesis protein
MPAPIPSVSDELHDGILTHVVSLLRVAAGERAKVLSLLEALEAKLIADLAQQVGKTPNAIARLQALLKQTQGTIAGAYAEIAANNGKALSKIAQMEAAKTVNVTNAALKVSVATVAQTPEQLAAIAGKSLIQGKFPKEWWAAQGQQLQDKFATAMREGMLKGEGVEELARRVRGTKAKGYADGMMVATKAQAEALVRTSVMTTANEARIATILGNPNINKAIQWVATLDGRTTLICKALDGLRWSVPELKPIGHDKEFPGPTAHWNCRSTQIPVTFSWAELAGAKNKLKAAGTEGDYGTVLKASLEKNGMTPEAAAAAVGEQKAKMATEPSGASGTVTFEAWLKGKTDEDVNALLGPGRAQLWRTGQVSIAEMTDQTNRPLSLAELEKMIAANAAVPMPKEGENGLSLADRHHLQDAMAHGAQFQEVLTHYVDAETGTVLKVTGTALTADQLAQVQAIKTLHVLQNSLAAGEVWGAQQFQLFGALPNFQKASLVGPTGRVVSVQVKPGKTFDQPAATAVLDKFAALKNTKTIPQTQQKLRSAVSDQGALKMTIGAADAVTLPPKTYNQAYPKPEKPAPFFDPAAETAKAAAAAQTKLEADAAAKAAAERAVWEATKKAADAEAAIEAEKAAAAADAMQARQAALKAIADADAAEAAAVKAAAEQKQKNDAAKAEIAAVIADPTGKKLLLKNIGLLLKAEPDLESAELLAKAKVQAIADQAKASTAAALSGYKQKVLDGKEPTPAQKNALASLEPAAQAKFLDGLKAAQQATAEAAAKKAAEEAAAKAHQDAAAAKAVADSKPEPAAPIVPVSLPEPEGFPQDPNNLKVVKKLGGTTGAELVQDAEGNRYVRKRGASAGHLREEVVADNLYRAAGLSVPECRMYETPTGPVKLARFVEGQTLADYLGTATAAQKKAVAAELRKGFAFDALMGNWDVLGTANDNVLVTKKGEVWRIDNGGSLRYRAQGSAKVGNQWDEHPTELWTMRGKQLISGDTATLPGNTMFFGELSIFDVARQATALDRAALAVAPADVRITLERRLDNMQAIGRKALEYERDGLRWKTGTVEEITRQMMGLREAGIVQALPRNFTNAGTTVRDENGLDWDHLRTKGVSGAAPAPVLAPGDAYWPTVKAALATFGHNASNGQPPKMEKINAALGLLPTLKQKAAAGDAMAKHYASALSGLEKNLAKYTGTKVYEPLPFLEPFKAPTTAGTPSTATPAQRTQSHISDLWDYIRKQGGKPEAVADWQGSQAGSSWSASAVAFKYWHVLNQDASGSVFWGVHGAAGAKAKWDAFTKQYGGVETVEKTFRAYAAFVQEFLGNADFKHNDRGRAAVRLVRTENQDVIRASKDPATGKPYKVGDYREVVLQKGANESHSIYQAVSIMGSEATAMAVPHTRITGLYWFERSAGGGSGSFLGEGENEFTANTNGLPVAYVPRADVMKIKPGGENDASKWNVPISHLP